MKKRAKHDHKQWVGRRRILLGGLAAAGLLVLGRSFQLQALEGEKWARFAVEQQQTRVPLPARRGAIYDRDGVPLALTAESFSIAIAPRELRDPRATATRLKEVLGLSTKAARRATDRRRRWVVLPHRLSAEKRARLAGIRGIHFERKLDRVYPQGDLAREVLGLVSRDGRPLGGIEQEMDSVLRGRAGWSVLRRDAHGQALPSASLPVVAPTDGLDVHLSIDLDLQEIAEVALSHAIDSTRASGGDLLLADPRTGELLAAVSRRPGGARGLAAFSETYEPGSTLKPFFVAALLARGKASLQGTVVHAENGEWRAPGGRFIRDLQQHEVLSLADALRVSSNIALVKLAPRLDPRDQFGQLRDLGFGIPTGVEYPAEAAGRLNRPKRWSTLTPGSLAMGYEVSVTPLQMTMAYGALANGGTLFEPRLVREVRGADGAVLRRVEPRPLRRAIPASVAEQLREVLISVVDGGTATRASLTTFEVAGKTGTARRTGATGRYVPGSYTSSFVGFFPARQPQLTLFVKLDDPQGAYTGGLTAAPVTRETLQSILAARGSPALSGQNLLASRLASDGPAAEVAELPASGPDGRYVFLLEQPPPAPLPAPPVKPMPLPELTGLPLRDAVRRGHELGLRVRLHGSGVVQATQPAAGAPIRRGGTLVLVGRS